MRRRQTQSYNPSIHANYEVFHGKFKSTRQSAYLRSSVFLRL